MSRLTKFIFLVAMIPMGLVSLWTSHAGFRDSFFPEPAIRLPNGMGGKWECSILALMLAVAIGMMLFALKAAIIDGHKRLNLLGVLGLALVGSISIAFNMDVLYRTANRDFYMSYSNQQVRGAYAQYLAGVQTRLNEKQLELRKIVARQEDEIEAEIKGLRAPSSQGAIEKKDEYKLTTMLAKQAEVELGSIGEALKTKEKAEQLLGSKTPRTVEEIQQLQNELRVTLKDIGAVAGVPLPNPVQTESPLFAVFRRLMDYRTIGMKEIFFLLLAILLDLGDICGYALLAGKRRDMVVAPAAAPVRQLAQRPGIPVLRRHQALLDEPERREEQ